MLKIPGPASRSLFKGRRLRPIIFVLLSTLFVGNAPLVASNKCPSYAGFREFSSADIQSCEGPTFRQSTGRQKVPKVGFSIASDNPRCGSKVKDVIFGIGWDGDGLPMPSVSEGGEYDEVKCKKASIRLPPGTKICGIRYWTSSSKKNRESKTLKERKSIQNTGKRIKHSWARKCPTLIKQDSSGTEVVVVFKNWRASYARYFQFEVEYQQE